ncbi:MAG TPA: hypothetical protein VGO80_13565 [Solirubrobacteraceae bacterium]|nr:hypothetical protein [Solirubrobacteraceae bacterium]
MLSVLVVLVLIALPSAAVARSPQANAPPGNSAIDEYLETVPGATGNQRPRAPGAASTPALTRAQRARLERLGPDGRTLADAVDATAPAAPASGAKPRKPLHDAPVAEGRSPLSAIADAATGRDGGAGMGVVLPAILIATLLGVIALVVARRRSVS